MLGNCATGKLRMVRVPTSTSTIEITMATMGRLMKNFDIELPSRCFRGKRLGVHLHARAHLLYTLSDHSFAWLESVRNHPLVVDTVTDRDRSNVDFVVAVHRRDLISTLQLRDCSLRYKQRILLDSDHRANLGVPAGAQNISGIGK